VKIKIKQHNYDDSDNKKDINERKTNENNKDNN
jgi:hypothetical protein